MTTNQTKEKPGNEITAGKVGNNAENWGRGGGGGGGGQGRENKDMKSRRKRRDMKTNKISRWLYGTEMEIKRKERENKGERDWKRENVSN